MFAKYKKEKSIVFCFSKDYVSILSLTTKYFFPNESKFHFYIFVYDQQETINEI